MLFNSYIFILFFLPVTLALYFGLNHFRQEKAAKAALIAMSLWFYAYFHVGYLAVILSSILANYGISRALLKRGALSGVERYYGLVLSEMRERYSILSISTFCWRISM